MEGVLRGGEGPDALPVKMSCILTVLPGILMAFAPEWAILNFFQCSEEVADSTNKFLTRVIGVNEVSTAALAWLAYKGRLAEGLMTALVLGLVSISIGRFSNDPYSIYNEAYYKFSYAVMFSLAAVTLAGRPDVTNVS